MPIPGIPYTDDQLFQLCHASLPAWLLLALSPRWKLTQAWVLLTALFFSALYAALIYGAIVNGPGLNFAEMSQFAGVSKLLATPGVVLPAWVHYIAFDLWTGRWIATDAAQRAIPRLLVAPILAATLMLGPVGLLMYLLIRGNWRIKTGLKLE